MLALAILASITFIICTRFNIQINCCCGSSTSFLSNNRYFRHAAGEMFVISRAIAQFISINKYATLCTDSISFYHKDLKRNDKYFD